MIGIDMMMPASCCTCRFENGNLSCTVKGYDTLGVRSTGRHPNCPLHYLDDGICVGDEVFNVVNGWRYVVTHIFPDGDLSVLHCPDGRATTINRANVWRTGLHYNVVETLLNKMHQYDDKKGGD